MYSNLDLNLGAYAFAKDYEELRDAGQNFRDRLLSDHLCLVTQFNFRPMLSLRAPQVRKANLLKKIDNMPYDTLINFKYDFSYFLKFR